MKAVLRSISVGVSAALLLTATSFFCAGAGHGVYFPIFLSSGPFCVLAPFSEIGGMVAFLGPFALWPLLFWLASTPRERVGKATFITFYIVSLSIGVAVSFFYDLRDEYFSHRLNNLWLSLSQALVLWAITFGVVQVGILFLWRRNSKAS